MTMKVPAVGITAIDTIGAGDNFASGFIAALLEGKNLRECARFAECNGGYLGLSVGATTGVKNRKLVEQLLEEYERGHKGQMKKIPSGTTDITLSRMGLGTWAIGGGPAWNGDLDRQICIDTILEAHRCGINLIDTAEAVTLAIVKLSSVRR